MAENLFPQDSDQGMQRSMQAQIEAELEKTKQENEALAQATHSEAYAHPEAFQALEEVDEALYDQVIKACEEVIDPELGVDIYNLGLIYALKYDGEGHLWVTMTLTMPGCPLADVIFADLDERLCAIESIDEVKVELVWTPAWTPKRLTRYARIALGFG